jgi:hypothetical protein
MLLYYIIVCRIALSHSGALINNVLPLEQNWDSSNYSSFYLAPRFIEDFWSELMMIERIEIITHVIEIHNIGSNVVTFLHQKQIGFI